MSLWNRLTSWGPATEEGIVLGITWARGKQIKPKFPDMVARYRAHPQLRYPIDQFASAFISGGFRFITYTEEDATQASDAASVEDAEQEIPEKESPEETFKETAVESPEEPEEELEEPEEPEEDEKHTRAEEAIEILDDWCEDSGLHGMDFDTWLYMATKDLRAFGNSIAERVIKEGKFVGLNRIPIGSLHKVAITTRGKITRLEQRIDSTDRVWKENELKRLVHFKWNAIDNGVFGRGLMDSMCISGPGYSYYTASNKLITEHRPPYAEIVEENEDLMRKQIHKSTTRHVYVLQGASKAIGTSLREEIQKLRPEDDIVLTIPVGSKGKPVSVNIEDVSQTRTDIDPQIAYFNRGVNMALQSPPTEMTFGGKGVTEATSRTIERIDLREVTAFQRLFRRPLERYIIRPILFDSGFEEDEIKDIGIRMRWGPITRVEITMDNVLKLGQANFVGRNEVREFISRAGFPLSDKPEFMGIQGGATVTDEGETRGSGASGYEKGQSTPQKTEGEEEAEQ